MSPSLRKARAHALELRAQDYCRYIPEWSALWQSFAREAEALKAGQPLPPPPKGKKP